ncbi:hypothetical protein ACN2WE_04925 [Streptomyces sp. cg28]|uniref:hypothetical protein n=1 Tax=Streptomyces sp. cg28 TaxID=3403457 RepID=UPI003B217579
MSRIDELIARWGHARAELADLEAAEHPDIVDHHGRTWVWSQGTLYRHCRLECPEPFITDGRLGLPKKAHLAIVDHEMCAICDPGRITAGAA